jgi:rhodanese-related sulfurtransferase
MKTASLLMILTLTPAALAMGQTASAPPASSARTAAEPTYKTKKLSRAEFDALLTHPERLLIIDVRRPDEVSSVGGLPVYLSIQSGEIDKKLSWIPKDRTIVTISNHANRSGRVGDVLTRHGFRVAGTVGVQDYEAEGGSLTKTQPSKTTGR